MKIEEALRWGIEKLKKAGAESPVLDAELLLAHSAVLQNRRMDRAWVLAHPEYELASVQLKSYRNIISRRAHREPLAYIVGHKEFYGLDFFVNKNVLIPRPETETLVEEALRAIRTQKYGNTKTFPNYIVDVGTGSGAIVVALMKTLEHGNKKYGAEFFATDISREALKIAKRNARRHGVEKRITLLRGNLLEPLFKSRPYTLSPSPLVVVANLPYLPTKEWRQTAPEIRKWEPREALDGGKDGLKCYRELFRQLYNFVIPAKAGIHDRNLDPRSRSGMTVLAELCPEQFPAFPKMVRQYFPKAKIDSMKDLSGRKRVARVSIK